MERFERIVVCVENSEWDGRLLDYVSGVLPHADIREVHVIHVDPGQPVTMMGEEVGFVDLGPGLSLDELRQCVDAKLSETGLKIHCEVVSGSPMLEILRYAMQHEAGLIVLGRRGTDEPEYKHEAVIPRRVATKSTCSVLVVPPDPKPKAERILVPVRDSECSANAVDMACGIALRMNAELECLNVFAVRSGYKSVGTSLEEHTALLEKWAERENEQLLQRVNRRGARLSTKCLPDLYGHPARIILEESASLRADLVVIGARGRSGAAGVLLGRVTEALIRQSGVPVLAVKKKGECLGLLQALLTLAGSSS